MKRMIYLLVSLMIVFSASALEKSMNNPLDGLEKTSQRDDLPKIIEGYIYSEDGVEMPLGTELYAEVIETGSYVYSSIKYGVPGLYSVGVTASLGDHAFVYSWNDTHWGQTDFIFTDHVMYIDVYMNNTFPNRPPELPQIANQETYENISVVINITATDLDGDELNYTVDGVGSVDNGVYSWTPSFYDAGVYEVTFTVTDGEYSDNQTINITVFDRNGPPELAQIENKTVLENNTLTFNLSATDPDNDDLQYSTSANFGSFDEDTGLFEYTPTIWDSGIYQVTFSVTDGEYFDDQQVTITVDDNGAPVQLKAFDALTAQEDSAVMIYPEPSNPNWASLELSIDSDLFTWDQELKAFRWMTGYQSDGNYTFTVTVDDGANSDQKAVHVTVNNNCHFSKKMWSWLCAGDIISDYQVEVVLR